jgi:DNA-binding response OmpR family regulator
MLGTRDEQIVELAHPLLNGGQGFSAPMPESLALVRLLHRRTKAAILAWRAQAPCAAWLDAGADMWLPRSASVEDLAASIRALGRRMPVQAASSSGLDRTWRLHSSARLLQTPEGHQIPLTETDSLVLECFANTAGAVVSYAELGLQLGHDRPDADNWLRATLYRLRRRIERATGEAAPIDAQARQGYLFRGRLQKEI